MQKYTRNCPYCQNSFEAKTSQFYCSFEHRFWSKVDTSGGPDACWPWLGPKDWDGYGLIKHNGRMERANRVALELGKGKLQPGQLACHKCDNPTCCNFNHLFPGTHKENHADRDAKGRRVNVTGEQHGQSKLNWEKVRQIRTLAGQQTQAALSEQFHISPRQIRKIITNKNWVE
jgi:hypothetical protein